MLIWKKLNWRLRACIISWVSANNLMIYIKIKLWSSTAWCCACCFLVEWFPNQLIRSSGQDPTVKGERSALFSSKHASSFPCLTSFWERAMNWWWWWWWVWTVQCHSGEKWHHLYKSHPVCFPSNIECWRFWNKARVMQARSQMSEMLIDYFLDNKWLKGKL